jgi:Zn-dependent protease
MIQVHCANCRTPLVFDDAFAGRTIACPDCGVGVRIPGPVDDPPAPGSVQKQPDHWRKPRIDDERYLDESDDDEFVSYEDEAVLRELEALQNQKAGWGSGLAILVVSLLLYIGSAGLMQIWESVAMLVPALAFHELGHFLAMRFFGYRNLQMFFVPFFGAGVTGRHYNIEGWKKAIVALAGPLPGIALGVGVGSIGLIFNEPILVKAAQLLIFLNGINLLPLSPFDGGWVVHAVLFVRHPVLDVVFRVVAALCLFPIAYFFQAWCLCAVGVFMLLAVPMAYRTARIAQQLGESGFVARSIDGQSIPDETALRILRLLREVLPPNTAPKILAQNIATVFETYNATPPGVFGSFALLFTHAAAFIVAFAMFIALAVIRPPA